MFDAKSILDALVRGAGQPQPRAGEPRDTGKGNLDDLLRQLPGGQAPEAAEPEPPAPSRRTRPAPPADEDEPEPAPRRAAPGTPEAGGLDLLRSVLGGKGGSLGDILGQLQQQATRPGGIGDILGQVLGQATSGVREGAGRLDQATGASRHARDAASQLTGRTPEDLIAQIRELMANNQLGTGVALGGLGALILGTGTGRSLAASAAKLGGLALIGGLAYKAYQNYQQGQPILPGGKPHSAQLLAAPDGSGFEATAATNDSALLYIRAMIAAAAADGRIDAREQQTILGGLKQAGIDAEAEEFLAQELNNPASVEELAAAVASDAEALQLYTAARVAVDPDLEEEHEFLAALAERLGIDDDLAAHIDATARGAGA